MGVRMGFKRPTFTKEFRAEAVRLVLAGRSIRDVAGDLGISWGALARWVKQGREAAKSDLSATDREELERLRREVEQLRLERDILKKAAAFFAKESR